jgi:hypothetical protein
LAYRAGGGVQDGIEGIGMLVFEHVQGDLEVAEGSALGRIGEESHAAADDVVGHDE